MEERIALPKTESSYHAGKRGEGLSETESDRYITMCIDRLEKIKANGALFQMRAFIESLYGVYAYKTEGRILKSEIDTRNKVDFYYESENEKNYARVGRSLSWSIATFGNVAIKPYQRKNRAGEASLFETQEVVKKIAPGINVNKIIINAPVNENGNPSDVRYKPGIYRWEVDDGHYLGYFARSPGEALIFINIEAISNGKICEAGYSLKATTMDRSDELEFRPRESIGDFKQLMGEFVRNTKGKNNLIDWLQEKINTTFWIAPEACFDLRNITKKGNALIIRE